MTETLSFEQQAYELPEIWDADYFSAEDHARIDELATFIPAQTSSILDVGCGNGLFVNYLNANHRDRFSRIAGVDRSRTALSHVKVEKKSANIDAIPFEAREFDTVTCMEVLEHIPVTVYPKALSEIARVAKTHIVISVPYRQDLKACLTECPSCCAKFNADFHVRSYDEATMKLLFSEHGFEAVESRLLGEEVVRYDQRVRAAIRRVFNPPAPHWWGYAICPVCGYSDPTALSEELARKKQKNQCRRESAPRTPSLLRRVLRNILPKKSEYRWIATTYRRN